MPVGQENVDRAVKEHSRITAAVGKGGNEIFHWTKDIPIRIGKVSVRLGANVDTTDLVISIGTAEGQVIIGTIPIGASSGDLFDFDPSTFLGTIGNNWIPGNEQFRMYVAAGGGTGSAKAVIRFIEKQTSRFTG